MAASEAKPVSPPFLRSCTKEHEEPIVAEIKGHIPSWLTGSLLRVGPGLTHVGQDKYQHTFDGLALLHRFEVRDGKVTYQNRFLKSDAYTKNLKANRIIVSEFGTVAAPDPCKTIFQRFASIFSSEFTDNDQVNIVKYSDEYYACTETTSIWRIDPKTLDSLHKANLKEFITVNTSTAHPHEGKDGTVYNMGSTFGSSSYYNIFQIPTKRDQSSGAFEAGSIVCRIPAARWMKASYYHSFGMTDKYFIFVEQPLILSLTSMLTKVLTSKNYAECLQWFPEEKARFFVVRREDGVILSANYTADAFFVFHHINAYEREGQLIVDLCCYEDPSVIKLLYFKALEESDFEHNGPTYLRGKAKRFVLPLPELLEGKDKGANLVTLPNSKATATLQVDGTVCCKPELLTGNEPWLLEMPRINYDYNERKYKYFYAIAKQIVSKEAHLIKVDMDGCAVKSWCEIGSLPSEPVFVSDPNSADEDGGVLLVSLLQLNDDKKVSLLVLDAKTMGEVGRATFTTESQVPADLHGIFISS